MASRDIAIACQGGGSHAAYTAGVLPVLLGEFDNLARAHAGDGQAHHPVYRESGLDPGIEAPVLVAISGTSGGAISALLGWYGFITGGADEARRRLDAFWDANSATHWVESSMNHYARAASDAASMFGWDVKSSPYAHPMQGVEWFNTTVWPMAAGALGLDNPWMRPDYFSLPQLLRPAVDWQLVMAYGDFASIPLEVQRWVRNDLQAALFAPDAPCQQRYRLEREAIERRIEDKLGAARRVPARIEQLGIGDGALIGAAFQRWQAPALRFEPRALEALATAVQAVTQSIPHLLIGAVELHQGDFVAFSSERGSDDGGLSIDAVLASAAVPWLFRARIMKGLDPDTLAPRDLALWDGLFSQNPPVKDFLAGVLDETKKPDEIWVVQINPSRAKVEACAAPHTLGRLVMSGGEIWDLRNALAGNLALNQELGFVDAINRRMEAAPAASSPEPHHDKLVRVDRIVMDGDAIEAATGLDLGANSKLDRDPQLKEVLCRHGRLQANRYLGLRSQAGRLCGELGDTLAGACASAAGADAGLLDGACRGGAGQGALVIDGATLCGTGADPDAPRALLRWRALNAEIDGRPVHIEGRSELSDDLDGGSAWRVKAVGITALGPRKAVPGGAAQPVQMGRSGQVRGRDRRGERAR